MLHPQSWGTKFDLTENIIVIINNHKNNNKEGTTRKLTPCIRLEQ